MKKVLFLFLLFIGLCACEKTEEKAEPIVPKIEITGSSQVTLPINGVGSLTFTSNVPWTATVKDTNGETSSWCILSATEGDEGSNRITITTAEDASPYDHLTAVITIVAANETASVSETIDVVWTADHVLVFSQKKIEPEPRGEVIGLALQSTLEYDIEILPESAKSWITPLESSKSLVEDSLYFEVSINDGNEAREAMITAKSKTQIDGKYLTDTVEVVQNFLSELSFSQSSIKPASKGEIIGLSLQSTVEYDIEITPESAQSWIIPVEASSKALVEDSLYFEVLANGENGVREATITARSKTQIQGDYLSDEVKVSQNSVCVFTLENSGWDIYSGGAYRYGPSIIINDDGSIDAWFAAPGAAYGKNHELSNTTGTSTAEGIYGDKTVAQKFTADIPFWGVSVTSPNWNGNPCGLTLSLYEWNGDTYGEVVAQEPIASARFDDYADGQNLILSNDDKFPAGTYLWVLSDGKTQQSGVWLVDGEVSGVTSYRDGAPVSGNWRARWTEEKTTGETFWDQASYQRSTDGGRTWSEEVMTLKPTEFSSDHFSVCDPGVAYWNGYYYIGYTSTENPGMTENYAYVARGQNPDGPWEKWNGNGWGGDPEPVVVFDGTPTQFGAGEPSIVVLDDTIYFYYSWCDGSVTTRVATASTNDPNWPGNLVHHGTAIDKSGIDGADHSDVKYREDIGKFQAINTASRMTANGYIMLWQSDDGLKFEKIAEIRDNIMPGCHNCGWSGDRQGHIRSGQQQYIAYAYGIGTWGVWNTRWAKINW